VGGASASEAEWSSKFNPWMDLEMDREIHKDEKEKGKKIGG
jgi:hypothetical protein